MLISYRGRQREERQQQEIADKMKKEDGFMQQLIIKIVNNVQIVINVSRSFGSSFATNFPQKKQCY
jgi:hypothetical protein